MDRSTQWGPAHGRVLAFALAPLLAFALAFAFVAAFAAGCGPGTAGTDAAPGTDAGPATDAGPPVDPDPDVASWYPPGYVATTPARVIAMGDSITNGTGASTAAGAYVPLLVENDPALWPGWDEVDLETLYPATAPLPLYDVSMGGAMTSDLLPQQAPLLEALLPYPAAGETIVVVTIGGNDLVFAAFNPGQIPAILQAIDDNLRALAAYFDDPARFPDGVFLYVTNVYEPSDGVAQADGCFGGLSLPDALAAVEGANANTRATAEEIGFGYVDLRGHFLGHGFYYDDPANVGYDAADPTLWFDADCIHPNDRGHHEIRRLFHAAIDGTPLPRTGP